MSVRCKERGLVLSISMLAQTSSLPMWQTVIYSDLLFKSSCQYWNCGIRIPVRFLDVVSWWCPKLLCRNPKKEKLPRRIRIPHVLSPRPFQGLSTSVATTTCLTTGKPTQVGLALHIPETAPQGAPRRPPRAPTRPPVAPWSLTSASVEPNIPCRTCSSRTSSRKDKAGSVAYVQASWTAA